MKDNTNKITDWLKQHGADSVEANTEAYHCFTPLFSYTIQERTVVALMEHEALYGVAEQNLNILEESENEHY